MNISNKGLDLIKYFEGFRDEAYKDGGGIWTIGYGTTCYPDKTKVKEHDHCSESQAQEWLLNDVANAVNGVNKLTFNQPLNQDQFDALVSFAYNLGLGALSQSTLYMMARQNPDDIRIYKYEEDHPAHTSEFTKWVNIKGRMVKGLLTRRKAEADLYCGKMLEFIKGGVRPGKPH